MQKGRFAQEFLAELMREPRALRTALLGERAKWLRGLKVTGREELLFEFDLLLRAVELSLDRRFPGPDGRTLLGEEFGDELRCLRDALHRATLVARRLTAPGVEQGLQFRTYLASIHADDARRQRFSDEAYDPRGPDEALFLLRSQLRALQGVADQLLRLPLVTFQAFGDFAVLAEQIVRGNRYFRPPSVLEFRSEYDRVGSVRLLELVKRVGESRARKALALGFLASFRLLRALRHVPAAPVAAPRRALLIARLVRDEALTVASYLSNDLPRLAAAASEAPLIADSAQRAADRLRAAAAEAGAALAARPIAREALDRVRERLSEASKSAAGDLSQAVEPGTTAAELFDGNRARRERAERLRRELWILAQLLRKSLDALYPAVRGEATRAFEQIAALVRFTTEFRQIGYYLLRSGDHEPFERLFGSLEALTNAAPSPARDRHLYLESRRFLRVAERAYALVSRRAELLGVEPDLAAFQAELERYEAAGTSVAPALDRALADQLLTPPVEDELGELLVESLDDAEPEVPSLMPPKPRRPAAQGPGGPLSDAPPTDAPPGDDADFDPELTRRIWRGE